MTHAQPSRHAIALLRLASLFDVLESRQNSLPGLDHPDPTVPLIERGADVGHGGSGRPRVSTPNGTSTSPTTKGNAVSATGTPMLP